MEWIYEKGWDCAVWGREARGGIGRRGVCSAVRECRSEEVVEEGEEKEIIVRLCGLGVVANCRCFRYYAPVYYAIATVVN